jgi:hypothetical protein
MRKLCTILAIAVLVPFAWVKGDDDQGPVQKVEKATKKAAEATGETIKHGAEATGSAISHGAKAAARTVGKGLEKTGNAIRDAGSTPTHVEHATTHTANAKPSPVTKESPTTEASPTPGVNSATHPSPTPGASPATTPATAPSPATP